jgi:hypothetical protein
MPLVVARRTSHLFVFVVIVYGHSNYFIVLFFIFYYYFFLIGVYRFDGSAFMRVVFMYRAAEGTEFEVPVVLTRATAPGFWLFIDSASPMLTVAHCDKELSP